MANDTPLPTPGTRVKCIDNTDRPELKAGEEYVVGAEDNLEKMPINYARKQPEDWRLIAIRIPGQKENLIFPVGIFEIVKDK